MTVFTVEGKFADANNDGVIGFGAANKKKYGTATAYYLGERDGLYHYGTTPDDVMPADPAPSPPPPPVVPPPPPPLPPVDEPDGPDVVQNVDGSVHLSDGDVSMVVRPQGSVLSLRIDGTEYINVGAPVQGFMLMQGTTKVRQGNLSTTTMTNGTNVGTHWRGSTAGMVVDQYVTLTDTGFLVKEQIANTGSKPITGFHWWADANPSYDRQKMSATATESRQGAIAVTSSDPRAFFYVTPVWDPRTGTVLPTATKLQAPKLFTDDRSIAVGFALNIAPGMSDTITFEIVR